MTNSSPPSFPTKSPPCTAATRATPRDPRALNCILSGGRPRMASTKGLLSRPHRGVIVLICRAQKRKQRYRQGHIAETGHPRSHEEPKICQRISKGGGSSIEAGNSQDEFRAGRCIITIQQTSTAPTQCQLSTPSRTPLFDPM